MLKLPRGEVYDMLRVKTGKKVGVTELVTKIFLEHFVGSFVS